MIGRTAVVPPVVRRVAVTFSVIRLDVVVPIMVRPTAISIAHVVVPGVVRRNAAVRFADRRTADPPAEVCRFIDSPSRVSPFLVRVTPSRLRSSRWRTGPAGPRRPVW